MPNENKLTQVRNKDLSGGEWPVVKMWYGKMAGKTIEEIIDNYPRYFIWMVKAFQDVTVTQAKHFQDRYEMELPREVIQDVIPYEYIYKHSPEGEYERLCKGEITIEETYGYKIKHPKGPFIIYPEVNTPSNGTNSPQGKHFFPLFIPPPKDDTSPEYKKWLQDYYWNRDILPNYGFYSQ